MTNNPFVKPDPDETESMVWIKTEPSLDGRTFVVTLEVSEDIAVTFDRTNAMEYAMYVLEVAERAGYDAAIVAHLTKRLSAKMDLVAQVVNDLRKDRPDLDEKWPIRLTPGVAQKGGHPFIMIQTKVAGRLKSVGQWTVPDAREHAQYVLSAVVNADLDSAYYRELTGLVGLEEIVARNVIGDLVNYRENDPVERG